MSGRAFLDTNVLVYLYDTDAPGKQGAARRVLEHGVDSGLVISTQVLQEFYVTITKNSQNGSPTLRSSWPCRIFEDFRSSRSVYQ